MAHLLRSQWRQPNTFGALIEKTVNQAQSQRILVSDERIRPESPEEKKKNLTLQRKETTNEPSQHWWNASALSTLLALLVVSKIITITIKLL